MQSMPEITNMPIITKVILPIIIYRNWLEYIIHCNVVMYDRKKVFKNNKIKST